MATVTLTLADPTTREDGSAIAPADLKVLNIYRTTGDGTAALAGTADPKATPPVFVDTNLVPGNYAYAVSGVLLDGREGKHGDLFPVVIAAPVALPSPPTIVSEVTT